MHYVVNNVWNEVVIKVALGPDSVLRIASHDPTEDVRWYFDNLLWTSANFNTGGQT